MVEGSLAMICVTAFVAVFVLLALLAAVMEMITRMAAAPPAPAKSSPASKSSAGPAAEGKMATSGYDQARIAAIASAYRRLFPDKKIIHIEEIQ